VANSGAYFHLVREAFEGRLPEYSWTFLALFTVTLGVFALLAETSGPRPNYVFQAFLVKAVLVLSLLLSTIVPREWFWLVLALECPLVAATYQRTGIVSLKVINLVLLLTSFSLCIVAVRASDTVWLGQYALPANWVFGIGVPGVFLAVAWFYEHFTDRLAPSERRLSGHWFLADTFLDVPCATAAMLHAAAAALILATLTIVDQGDRSTLPYVLALESVAVLALGRLMRTAQVEVGAVLLLVAAHASFYFFLMIGMEGFEDHPGFIPYTILIVLATHAAAYRWDRYLKRIPTTSPREHHAIAAIPHIMAVAMSGTLLARVFEGPHIPLAQSTLGLLLLMVGLGLANPPVAVSGIAALAYGCGSFAYVLYAPNHPPMDATTFPAYLLVILATYTAAERALYVVSRNVGAPSRSGDAARTFLVFVAGVIGVIGLREWAPAEYRTLLWLAHAAVGVIVGVAFRESRYRWAALGILALAAVAIYRVDVAQLTPPQVYQRIAAAVIVFLTLALSWSRALWRKKSRPPTDAARRQESTSDG
jgi:hypothetical protein